jgi:hypothetical protein
MKSPAKAGNDAVETGRQIMDIRLDKDALAADDAMTMIRARPLDRAKAISGLINEEALASERLGRLTDKAAAAMLDANLFSIRLPRSVVPLLRESSLTPRTESNMSGLHQVSPRGSGRPRQPRRYWLFSACRSETRESNSSHW